MNGMRPLPRPQHQCAASTACGRIRPSATSRRSSRRRACAATRSTPASTSTCRHGARCSSPTTRSSIRRTTPTVRSACPPTATTSPPSGVRAASIPRHIASAVVNTPLPKNLRLGVTDVGAKRDPYNITTGRDDNGDTVFNDRPAGVGRNSAMTEGHVGPGRATELRVRLRPAAAATGPGGGPTMVIRSVGGRRARATCSAA